MKIFDDLDKTREREKKGRGVDAAVIKKLKDNFFTAKGARNSFMIQNLLLLLLNLKLFINL